MGNNPVSASTITSNPLCWASPRVTGDGYVGCDVVAYCVDSFGYPTPLNGRYVSIQITGNTSDGTGANGGEGAPDYSKLNILMLCEVKVCPLSDCICGDSVYPNTCPFAALETDALLALKSSVISSCGGTPLSSWTGAYACSASGTTTWAGVTCNGQGSVTSIQLGANCMLGTLPASWSKLTNLNSLYLGVNSWSGTLPPQWSTLTNLNGDLWLNVNLGLTGSFPLAWSTLTGLTHLDLKDTSVYGSIPSVLVGKVVGNVNSNYVNFATTALQPYPPPPSPAPPPAPPIASGTITTIAGTGTAGYSGDGQLATSAMLNLYFYQPFYLTYDPSVAIIIADTSNHRIRRVDLATGIITTVAGKGTAGYGGDGGLAIYASINQPSQAIYGPDGCLYISDYLNHRIRKVDTQGYISTIAGTGEKREICSL